MFKGEEIPEANMRLLVTSGAGPASTTPRSPFKKKNKVPFSNYVYSNLDKHSSLLALGESNSNVGHNNNSSINLIVQTQEWYTHPK